MAGSSSASHAANAFPFGGEQRPIKVYSPRGGDLRDAVVCLPRSVSAVGPTQRPLIIALHGKNQTPDVFATESRLSDPELNNEYIVVYPIGLAYQWTGDPNAPSRSQVDDVQFIDDLLKHMIANFQVDVDRIFLAGFSNGAGLAALVACHPRLSRAIRAVAMASVAIFLDEAFNEPTFGKFEATKFPVPLLEFHGDADPVVDYNGIDSVDGLCWPMGDWLRGYTWMTEKGLHGHVLAEEAEETMLYDGRVERFAWKCGTEEELVVHYIIRGFGHGWPSTLPIENEKQRHGPTIIDATPIIFEFFRKAARYETRTSE